MDPRRWLEGRREFPPCVPSSNRQHQLSMVRCRHIPALPVATIKTPIGLWPFVDARGVIDNFGLPAHVAESKPAQSVMTIHGSRATIEGILLFTLFTRGMYEAVDIVLMLHACAGAADALICWREGNGRKGLNRGVCRLTFAAWGSLGWTQGT